MFTSACLRQLERSDAIIRLLLSALACVESIPVSFASSCLWDENTRVTLSGNKWRCEGDSDEIYCRDCDSNCHDAGSGGITVCSIPGASAIRDSVQPLTSQPMERSEKT